MQTAIDRFEAKFCPEPMSGCWIWLAANHGKGYGSFNYLGAPRKAHRVAYELYVGPIPEGLEIRHTCHMRWCVNPEHMVPGTHAENIRDMHRAGRAWQQQVMQCPRGHLLPAFVSGGRRHCKECGRRWALEYYYKTKR